MARRFIKNCRGSTATVFAMVLPVIVGTGGFATDYVAVTRTSNRLQSMVDSAALAVAREMILRPLSQADAQTVVSTYMAANIPANIPYPVSATVTIEENGNAARVNGSQQVDTPFGFLERIAGVTHVSAVALARITASPDQTKLCLLSLSKTSDGGIYAHNGAYIDAKGCTFYSNSTNKASVILSQNSTIRASLICARGGVTNQASAVEGTIVTDCPAQVDPLAGKPEPSKPIACKALNLKIKNEIRTLDPGHYCFGLDISGTAKVTLNPGIYYISNGDLRVKDSAELIGNGVTLMFDGIKSYFRFEDNALIRLVAPTSGSSAGMLIWESQTVSPLLPPGLAKLVASFKAKNLNEHHINSNRAYQLTGTIYLPRGLLTIDSVTPIAEQSDYTIMVVNKLDLFDGPKLVLNSNYKGSNIPVPKGLGPIGASQLKLGQ